MLALSYEATYNKLIELELVKTGNLKSNTIAAMAKYSLTISVTLALQVHGFVVSWPTHSMVASSIDATCRPLTTCGKYAHV